MRRTNEKGGEEIQEVLDTIDMETVLSREGIDHKRTVGSRGPQLHVKSCPVCGHDGWKVYLNAESGLGNCFAGSHPPGQNFNKWSFIKAYLGSDNAGTVDYIKQLARELGWQPKAKRKAVDYNTALTLPESIALPHNGMNVQYLVDRGVDAELARFFNLRLCTEGWFKYEMDGKTRSQCYSNRIIIPIFDLDGKLVSFQGRDITGTAERKYLFPPGFAATGRYLYNGHNALGCETIVMGEGAFDCIAIKRAMNEDKHLAGTGHIASFGKSLSIGAQGENDQLTQIMRLKEAGMKDLVIMWDGEKAAQKAAVKAALELRRWGIKVRLGALPADLDPNEVHQSVVRECFYRAQLVTPSMAVTLGS